MHRGLLIPEIIRHVMEYLYPCTINEKQAQKHARATLLNIALTCSSLSGPALDALWHTMDDLIPLFKLLPNFELSPNRTVPSNIRGPVLEDNISAFNAYAHRIKRYKPETINNIDPSAYNAILQCCGRPFLLPNLTCFESIKVSLDDVLFLLCPRLQEMTSYPFIPWGSRDNPRLFLNSLQSMSPNLLVLRLRRVVLDRHSLSAFCSLTRLEKLTVRGASSETVPLTLDFLFDMSARYTLRHLELEGGDLEVVPSLQANRDPVNFPALEKIHIDCFIAIDSIAIFLRNATFPVLEFFKVGPQKPHQLDMQEHWHQVFDNISRATSGRFYAMEFTGPSCESSVRLHLFDLPKLVSLTSFSLDGVVLGLNHHDVTAVVDAWPMLTSLILQHFEGIPEMTFSVLITIARGLPRLQYLAISIDTAIHPDFEEIPLLCHGLYTLILSNSPVDDPEFVARSLDRLFPNFQIWDFGDGTGGLWEQVESLLEMFHQVRKEEATRLALGMSKTSPVPRQGAYQHNFIQI